MILELLVSEMPTDSRAALFALSDRQSELTGAGKTLWGIWQTNCIPLGSYRTSAVFPTVARLNHSCLPNASMRWCPELRAQQVRAAAPVATGEEVSRKKSNC